jgi:tripartite-type tricarboxylate transporter receptor subunit TctC
LIPTFFALATPAGTPDRIVATLNAEMRAALGASDVAEILVASGLIPSGSSPQALSALVTEDVARFGALARSIGLKAE